MKITMRQFIFLFIFFLALTLGLFLTVSMMGLKTLRQNLISASEKQFSYAESILEASLSEASLYGAKYAGDSTVRFYQSQLPDLSAYDAQQEKNSIEEELKDQLISSQSVDSIGIYWKSDGTYISTDYDGWLKPYFNRVSHQGWQSIDGELYYFCVYPYPSLSGPQQPVQFVIGVKLKNSFLLDLLGKAVADSHSQAFYLIGKTRLFSASPIDSRLAAKVRTLATSHAQRIRQSDYRGASGDYYILSEYIEPIDSYLITYTRTSDFLNPLKQFQRAFSVSILLILAIGLSVLLMFYQNFYRNVHLLCRNFQQVEEGRYETRILVRADREFNLLFQSFNHMVENIQTLFHSLKEETELRKNAEIKQLYAQINPHFLYNSLFFIMSVAHSSPEMVEKMSRHLAEYYRYLTNIDQHPITLSSELKLAGHYLSIMVLCKNLDYTILLPPALENLPILPLIIQPVVENAVRHGIESRQGAHRISIAVTKQGANLHITVSDDGKGLSPEQMDRLSNRVRQESAGNSLDGIALWNIQHRLTNTYGKESGLQFQANSWGGLSVVLVIHAVPDQGGNDALAYR